MATECNHDFVWNPGDEHEHEHNGVKFRFRTYQCVLCGGWTSGALRFENGKVILKEGTYDDRELW